VAVGRKIEDESEAERCLSAVRRSGLSAGEWGRAHGVDGRSLHAWQMNLERRSEAPRPKRRKPQPARPAHALVELLPATRSLATSRGARVSASRSRVARKALASHAGPHVEQGGMGEARGGVGGEREKCAGIF
jgi:hypothetical protein